MACCLHKKKYCQVIQQRKGINFINLTWGVLLVYLITLQLGWGELILFRYDWISSNFIYVRLINFQNDLQISVCTNLIRVQKHKFFFGSFDNFIISLHVTIVILSSAILLAGKVLCVIRQVTLERRAVYGPPTPGLWTQTTNRRISTMRIQVLSYLSAYMKQCTTVLQPSAEPITH